MRKITIIGTLVLALSFGVPASSNWTQPFSGSNPIWDAEYLAPETEYGAGHRGVDLAIEMGRPILAPFSGEITFADLVVDRPVVTIRSNSGYLASFEPVCTSLSVGSEVFAKAELGWHCPPQKGYQYHCEGCVHFSARSRYGYLSPDYFLEGLRPSVLTD